MFSQSNFSELVFSQTVSADPTDNTFWTEQCKDQSEWFDSHKDKNDLVRCNEEPKCL